MIVLTWRKLRYLSTKNPKINFIINLLPEIFHFKEPCNLIGQQYFENSARYVISGEISITIVWILDYFLEKTKSFKKHTKKLFWGHFGSLLEWFWLKKDFFEKMVLSVFKYSNHLPSYKKIRKNWWPIPEKIAELTDGQIIDRQNGIL